jgi:hypothetical protein
MKFEIFSRPQTPHPATSSGFPSDAVVVVIPRVLLERLLMLVIFLVFGGTITMQVTMHSLNVPVLPTAVKSK